MAQQPTPRACDAAGSVGLAPRACDAAGAVGLPFDARAWIAARSDWLGLWDVAWRWCG